MLGKSIARRWCGNGPVIVGFAVGVFVGSGVNMGSASAVQDTVGKVSSASMEGVKVV